MVIGLIDLPPRTGWTGSRSPKTIVVCELVFAEPWLLHRYVMCLFDRKELAMICDGCCFQRMALPGNGSPEESPLLFINLITIV